MKSSKMVPCEVVLREGATDADAKEFRRQVKEFLDGVVHFDGPSFYRHLSREHFVLSILPASVHGEIIRDYDKYVTFHESWNRKKGTVAKFCYNFVLLYLSDPNRGFALIKVTYEDQASDRTFFRKKILIKDHFIRREGVWFMTENQNTVIEHIQLDHLS